MAKTANVTVQGGQTTRQSINGAGVAAAFLKTVAEQGATLLTYLNEIFVMDHQQRLEFRKALTEHLKTTRDQIAGLKAQVEDAKKAGDVDTFQELNGQLALLSRGFESAKVRISEANRFAEACDAGFADFSVADGYHKCIAKVRLFLRAKVSKGGKGPGKTPKTAAEILRDAVQKVLNDAKATPDECATILETLAKDVKEMEQSADAAQKLAWEAKLAASMQPAAAPKGPTQRKERRGNKGANLPAGVTVDHREDQAPANVH